jgi:PAS domain S-box-containing protein
VTWQYGSFAIALGLSATVSITVALSLWPRRHAPGAGALIALLCSTAWWAAMEIVQYGAQELDAKVFWTNMVYLAIVSAPVFWFIFCLQYSRVRARLRASELASLWLIPIISLVLLWASPTDGLMRRNVSLDLSGPVAHMLKTYGPWFWVMVGYSYLLMLSGSVFLLRLVQRSGRVVSAQAMLLLLGLLCPWVSNLVWLVGSYDWFSFDPTSIAFGISGALLAAGMRWNQLFDLVPAARDMAIESMRDGWLVVDTSDRILDANPAARRMLGSGDPQGRHLSTLAPQLSPLLRSQMDRDARDETAILGSGAQARHYLVEMSNLTEHSGLPAGHVITLRDITRRVAVQQEREELIQALQDALGEVRELSGLLPICAHCKKIRDDQGYWTHLEHYIAEHSRASFTHGLCPDCMQRMMRDAGLPDEDVAE